MKIADVKLTDNPLKNIYIMAPLLSELDQNKVFGLIVGLLKTDKESNQEPVNTKGKR